MKKPIMKHTKHPTWSGFLILLEAAFHKESALVRKKKKECIYSMRKKKSIVRRMCYFLLAGICFLQVLSYFSVQL